MEKVFSVEDRQSSRNFIMETTKACEKVVALVQVGSGAKGYNDSRSDLDFVIALDKGESMLEVMEYMHEKISETYEIVYFSQEESKHLQCYLLSNMLEIDLGFGGYERAAAWKPDFKVLFDRTGVVEEKMIKSREWMDDSIYGPKEKEHKELACDVAWAHLMHVATAISRGNFLRVIGELEYVRKIYVDLLGDKFRLDSGCNHDIDKLPKEKKDDIRSTLVTGESKEELWRALINLTNLLYKELEGEKIAVSRGMLEEYYKELRK